MKKRQKPHKVHLSILRKGASIIYAPMKLLPTQNKVTFISRINRKTSIDFQLIANEIKKGKKTKVVILNHRMDSKIRHTLDILSEMYHLATSKSVIIDSYVIPVSILKHKPDLTIVQIWHALGAIKDFGYKTLDKPAGNPQEIAETMEMHKNYTHIIAGGQATVPIFAECFGVNKKVIEPIGLPRVDYLLDKETQRKNLAKFKKRFASIGNRKVILYAPTFRKGEKIPVQKLIDQINFKKYALIIKQHTLDKTKIQKHPGIYVVKDNISMLELLPGANFIITDYSATTFEAALLKKPLFFWAYDLEKYGKNCGFAMDYREMPGIISKDPAEIVKAIESKNFSLDKIKAFAKKYVSTQDGTCSKKIISLLGTS